MQLKLVTATGHILFTGPGAEIHALYMQYDPTTHWLIARGNERERVDFTISTQPGGPKLAEEIQYNLDSGEVRATKMQVKMAR
jgi:elongation factor P hydroxylase